ncbi:LuxR C-terminal-related transcriptional regulator [Streptomyces wuyuanensis]|uniref:LuxR C-terminal-related transcriptional regulator n=1 Tax=Streptomyces wuyuanensis TaxID=1196353 RepID=UPI003433577F
MNHNGISDAWPFVGRTECVSSFLRILGDKKFNAFIVKGEPGVGKSRLARECLRKAAGAGHRVARSMVPSPDGYPLAALAHLLPEDFKSENPETCFHQVRERILSLTEGKRRNRFVLLVDELHLMDPASALLISQLLDAGLVFLIATLPFEARLGNIFGAIERSDSSVCVELQKFSPAEVETLLDAVLGGLAAPAVSSELHRLSDGNAYYLRELTTAALEREAIRFEQGVWILCAPVRSTRRLREIFALGLSDLDEAAREVLDLVALCGSLGSREYPADPVCKLESSGLVRSERQGSRERLMLTHPLYREMLDAAIPAARRRHLLSRRLARTLDYGARRSLDKLDTALWELEVKGSAERTVLLQGARIAMRREDYSAARRLATAANRSERDYHSQLLLGQAMHEMGEGAQAENILELVDQLAESDEERARVALIRSHYLAWCIGDTAKALEVNDVALSRIKMPSAREDLENNRTAVWASLGKHAQVFTESRHSPRAHDVWSMAVSGKCAEALTLWRRHKAYLSSPGAEESAQFPNPTHFLIPAIFATAEAGRIDEAYAMGLDHWRRIHRLNLRCSQISLSLIISRCAMMGGRPRTARRWACQAAAMAAHINAEGPSYAAASLTAEASLMAGDVAGAEEALCKAKPLEPWGPFVHEGVIGQAGYAARKGDIALARDLLLEASAEARGAGNMASEGRILVELGRMGDSEIVVERLAEISSFVQEGFISSCARYMMARVEGNPKELLLAAHSLERIGANLLAAEAAAAAASSWRRRHRMREATAAGNKAVALARMCEGATTSDLVTTPPAVQLTRREREITLLITQRLTNAEIAERVQISRRTVENHLQNIYRKVGVASRNELRRVFASDRSAI